MNLSIKYINKCLMCPKKSRLMQVAGQSVTGFREQMKYQILVGTLERALNYIANEHKIGKS